MPTARRWSERWASSRRYRVRDGILPGMGGGGMVVEPTALESRHLVVPGDRAELELGDGRLVLRSRSSVTAEQAERVVGVDQVRGATLRPPSRGEPGWLHVSVVGGTPAPSGGLSVAMDPYTIPLASRGGVAAARRLVKMVERHLQERGKPRDTVASDLARSTGVVVRSNGAASAAAGSEPEALPVAVEPDVVLAHNERPVMEEQRAVEEDGPAAPGELVERLKELAALRDSGALTEAEFKRAKKRVIG